MGSAPGPRWGLRPQTPIRLIFLNKWVWGLVPSGVQGQSPWPFLLFDNEFTHTFAPLTLRRGGSR
jgi:hypothetical protein